MPDSDESKPEFSRGRRWLMAFNSIAGITAAFALVVMANYLASGHYLRQPLSKNASFKLSPMTVNVLQGLTNDVKITLFFQPHGDEEELYGLTSSLLAEYHNANPKHIQVQTLDDTRYPGEGKALLTQLKLTELKDKNYSRNFILIEVNGHSKIIFSKNLSSYDLSGLISGTTREVRRNAFRGELLFTSAIFALNNAQQIKTYFLFGHGEHSPLSGSSESDNSGTDENSYSKLATLLKEEVNSDWQKLSLQGTNQVPADCQLMIIAGPDRSFSVSELEKIDNYLKQGGRLFVLLNDDLSIAPVLAKWGVGLGEFPVEEHDNNYRNSATDRDFLTAYGSVHPITSPLIRDNLSIRIVSPHPVVPILNPAKTPGAPEVTALVYSSASSTSGGKKGNFPLITTVEQGVIKDVNARRGGTRIVVAGDSTFLSDKMLYSEEANHYFASLAINWLLERPDAILNQIGPRPITEYKLFMTRRDFQKVRWLFLAGMPGAVLALGFLVWLRRRN